MEIEGNQLIILLLKKTLLSKPMRSPNIQPYGSPNPQIHICFVCLPNLQTHKFSQSPLTTHVFHNLNHHICCQSRFPLCSPTPYLSCFPKSPTYIFPKPPQPPACSPISNLFSPIHNHFSLQ